METAYGILSKFTLKKIQNGFWPHWGILLMLYSLEKEPQNLLLHLLLQGTWCQLRVSVQWNQIDEMGTNYSAIFIDLSTTQIWANNSTFIFTACTNTQWFFRVRNQWFQIHQCNISSRQLETRLCRTLAPGICLSSQPCWWCSWKPQPGHLRVTWWQCASVERYHKSQPILLMTSTLSHTLPLVMMESITTNQKKTNK